MTASRVTINREFYEQFNIFLFVRIQHNDPRPGLGPRLLDPASLSNNFGIDIIFPQASPLVSFFHFHETFLVHSDYDACLEYLNAFKKSYNKVCKRENNVLA